MYCAKCGASLAENAKKCDRCGTPARIRPVSADGRGSLPGGRSAGMNNIPQTGEGTDREAYLETLSGVELLRRRIASVISSHEETAEELRMNRHLKRAAEYYEAIGEAPTPVFKTSAAKKNLQDSSLNQNTPLNKPGSADRGSAYGQPQADGPNADPEKAREARAQAQAQRVPAQPQADGPNAAAEKAHEVQAQARREPVQPQADGPNADPEKAREVQVQAQARREPVQPQADGPNADPEKAREVQVQAQARREPVQPQADGPNADPEKAREVQAQARREPVQPQADGLNADPEKAREVQVQAQREPGQPQPRAQKESSEDRFRAQELRRRQEQQKLAERELEARARRLQQEEEALARQEQVIRERRMRQEQAAAEEIRRTRDEASRPERTLSVEEMRLQEARRIRRYYSDEPDAMDHFFGKYGMTKEAGVKIATLFLIVVLSVIYVMGRGKAVSDGNYPSAGKDTTAMESSVETDPAASEGQGIGQDEAVPTGGGDFEDTSPAAGSQQEGQDTQEP